MSVQSLRAAVEDHPLGVQVERNARARMADGVTLYADIFRPLGEGPWPVLLMRQPYGKLIASAVTYAHPSWYARRGFMVVVQDVRGRGASGGDFYPFQAEAQDGLTSVEWAASLPGSNGNVGMYGFSYQGFTQLVAAGQAPPALKAIAPAMAAGDLYRHWFYVNGMLHLGTAVGWGTQPARDGAKFGRFIERQDELVQALGPMDRWTSTLPIERYPLLRGDPLGRHFFDWISHPTDHTYWDALGMGSTWSSVATPALHVAGWFDQYLVRTIAAYARLREEAATPPARTNQRLIIGPWPHQPWTRRVGMMDYGPEANSPVDDLQVAWFNRWLRDEPADAAHAPTQSGPPSSANGRVLRAGDGGSLPEDRVRLFVMGANRWVSCPDWPPPTAETRTLYLSSDGRANGLGGDGRLLQHVPANEPPDVYLYDPRIATPSGEQGPAVQTAIENRMDVLLYTGEPLAEPLVVAGSPEVTLWAASTAEDTDFIVRLCMVGPDGTSRAIVTGGIRARYREGGPEPVWLEREKVYRYDFALPPTCQLIPDGHRIRIHVASAAFPLFDRNPNTRVEPVSAHAHDFQFASQVVLHDHQRPSQIRLPVAPASWARSLTPES